MARHGQSRSTQHPSPIALTTTTHDSRPSHEHNTHHRASLHPAARAGPLIHTSWPKINTDSYGESQHITHCRTRGSLGYSSNASVGGLEQLLPCVEQMRGYLTERIPMLAVSMANILQAYKTDWCVLRLLLGCLVLHNEDWTKGKLNVRRIKKMSP